MENFDNIQQQEENIDIKALFFKFARYWYLFGTAILVAIVVAFLFNKYTRPEYEVKTTVLIKDNKSNLNASSLLGFGLTNSQQNLQNEIGKLLSFSLAYRTIQKLNFEITYSVKDGFITKELYKTAPFEVVYDTAIPQAVGLKYNLKFINKNEYSIEAAGELIKKYNYSRRKFVKGEFENVNFTGKYRFGELVHLPYNTFEIILNNNFNPKKDLDKDYQFVFNDFISLTKRYMGVKVEPINKEASIVKITLKSNTLPKAVDYLNMLTKQYLKRNLEVKNRIAENTIKFINSQLRVMADTLQSAELKLQKFRSSKKIMDISFQSKQVFKYMSALEKQKAEMLIKSKYYYNLRDYILKNEDNLNNLVAPSAMGIEDPALNVLVAQLIEFYNKKAESLLYATEKSPTVVAINSQILSTKQAIVENVTNIIYNSNQAIAEITARINKISSKLNQLPITQRHLLNFERKFTLADNIYTFLLEKRSDAQITKASNMPDNSVVDKARVDESNAPVFPKKGQNYLIALILGLAFPVVYVLGKDYFNNKIMERKDVEEATDFPIIGQLLHNTKDSQMVVAEYPNSGISESFRSLRTNIQYLVQGKSPVTIMVTSDITKVGKTFASINLASVYAQYGKKTVLLGFDMRKPKIYHDFKLTNDKGLTSFFIGKDILEDIIQPSGVIDHLDIIMAGPVPPNPAELIASDKNTELFVALKKRYDYIIIDTPPIGLVTDAFLLMPYSDVNIYVVRQNFSNKRIFASIIKDIKDRGMKMSVVFNDISVEGSYGYSYGYSYGQQGSSYYTDDKLAKKNSFIRRLLNKV